MDLTNEFDSASLVNVPLVQINEYGISSVLLTSSQEKTVSESANENLTSQFTPITPNKSPRIQEWQPLKVVQIATERSEKEERREQDETYEDNSRLAGTESKENEVALVKTPRKNAQKRKKYMPKVLREDKPAKKPKPERSTPKRVYVRRKNVENMDQSYLKSEKSNDERVTARKSARRRLKFNLDSEEVEEQLTTKGRRSTRRSLIFNFDTQEQEDQSCSKSEKSSVDQLTPKETESLHGQEREDQSSSKSGKSSASQEFADITESCSEKFTVNLSGLEVEVKKSPVGIAFDLNRSLTEILDEYLRLPELPKSSSECDELKIFHEINNMESTDQDQVNSHSDSDSLLIEDGTNEIETDGNDECVDLNKPPLDECSRDVQFKHVYKRRTKKVKASQCDEVLLNNFRDLSLTDRQKSKRLDELEDPELMLAVSHIMRITKKRSKIPTNVRKYGTCRKALSADTHCKVKTRKRKNGSSRSPNMRNEYEAALFRYHHFVQNQVVLCLPAPSASPLLRRRSNNFQHTSAQNHRHSSNTRVPFIDEINALMHKLKGLAINQYQLAKPYEHHVLSTSYHGVDTMVPYQHGVDTMVPYQHGVDTMVPYQHIFGLVRKKRPRPKVDLDPETSRVWNLLMGSDNVDENEKVDKEKRWEEERGIYRGRIDSFIARMHLVLGDRRFSKWKGSVVDSVVGVFLTQNVADHLSSSAFISLAARYPINPQDDIQPQASSSETENISQEEGDDAIKLQEKVSISETGDLDSTGSHEPQNLKEVAASDDSESLGSHNNNGLENSKLGSKTLAESEDTTFTVETVPSKTTFLAQGSPSETLGRPASQVDLLCSESISEADNTAIRSICCDELISVEENWLCAEAGKRTTSPDILDSSRGSSPSTVESETLINYVKNDVKSVENVFLPPTSVELIETCNKITKEELVSSSNQQVLALNSKTTTVKQYVQTDNLTLSGDTSDKRPQIQDVKTSDMHKEKSDSRSTEEAECSNSRSKVNENSVPQEEEISNFEDEISVMKNRGGVGSSRGVKKMKTETPSSKFHWDSLRKESVTSQTKKERSCEQMDSLDWDAVRCADVNDISKAIRERGMNDLLAGRIKDFLNRVFQDHDGIDLEWLRDIPPDKAKDYLLSIRGLGLKSVECVRLLTLHHIAFPVDTNVGRVCVRLGWVPIQPLPESLQLHLLEMYPVIEHIQKYLWPRICTLDQQTLYELHYQMITFGKVFCTKSKPNCNACPMRGECKHFASAFASARLSLPGPEEKRVVISRTPIVSEEDRGPTFSSPPVSEIENNLNKEENVTNSANPIIEEPSTPEQDCTESLEKEIEDDFYEDPDEIPTIKLNLDELTENLQNYIEKNNLAVEGGDLSKALVALSAEAASMPVPKLKNVSRLRTEHLVYELPDSHPLLETMDQREHNDPSPYLLAIWTPGETSHSSEPPQSCCNVQGSGELCDKKTCFACNSRREELAQTVRGTILIPCRTAMRGSFPLNGTYFQVNEVFADHSSSCKPIDVPRKWIWNLPRRTVYFGTSVTTIFRGLTMEQIQFCFWKGFICVRGFDRVSRAPKPLFARLHFPLSKTSNTRKMDPNEGHNNSKT